MLGFILLLLVMIGGWVALLSAFDIQEIKTNWPKYRCRPTILPFTSFYGYDTQENFNFCLQNIFSGEMGGFLGPVFTILAKMLRTLGTLLAVANSLRLQLATFVGGVNVIFQNFTDRIAQLTYQIRNTASRMRFLMRRVFATMYSIMYMSTSAIRSMTNFGDTVLFGFLDTFCFDPDTMVEVEGKGKIRIAEAKIGDILSATKSKITSTFSFEADGQPMVFLPSGTEQPPIYVSTNHYVQVEGKWRRADEHPEALPAPAWQGGVLRPLICLNTNNHLLPVGKQVFLDYDETEKAEQQTMMWAQSRLNGEVPTAPPVFAYDTVFSPETKIRLREGSTKEAKNIELGEDLSTGRVIAKIQKVVSSACLLSTGERVSVGQLVWNSKKTEWERAGQLLQVEVLKKPEIYYSFIVSPTANIETEGGHMFRDYFEVHSPDAEQYYSEAIECM